jgi:hypothetical protein
MNKSHCNSLYPSIPLFSFSCLSLTKAQYFIHIYNSTQIHLNPNITFINEANLSVSSQITLEIGVVRVRSSYGYFCVESRRFIQGGILYSRAR